MVEPVDTPQDEGPRAVKLTDELTVTVKQPTEEQLAVLIKSTRAAERNLQVAGVPALDIFFRVLTSLLVDLEDVDRIDEALITGQLKIGDLAQKALGFEVENAKPANRRARRAR